MVELIVTIFAGLGFCASVYFVIGLIEKFGRNANKTVGKDDNVLDKSNWFPKRLIPSNFKELFLKVMAAWHIFYDTESAVYTIRIKNKDGHLKRIGGCCYISDKISHITLDTISEYTQQLKDEIELSELDKLLNYDKDK